MSAVMPFATVLRGKAYLIGDLLGDPLARNGVPERAARRVGSNSTKAGPERYRVDGLRAHSPPTRHLRVVTCTSATERSP
jgi:hypothetical protein